MNLETQTKWQVPRPFLISAPGEPGMIRYYNDRSVIEHLRELGYVVKPIVDENIPVLRYVELPSGRGQKMCEICEDIDGKAAIRLPATRKIFLANGNSRLVCRMHNPIEKERWVYGISDE